MPYQVIQLTRAARTAFLTFNRPEKRNALSFQMLDELLRALDEVEKAGDLVLVLTGAGQAFCAGMDLEELRSLIHKSPPQHREESRRMAQVFRRLYDFPRPTIAAVNGAAIAGGTGLATMCDFTLAVPQAKFGYTEVRIGFVPAIVSSILVWQVGHKTARELLLSGRIFDAQEAYRLGLVDQLVSPDTLLARARELSAQLLENSPTSLVATKKLVNSFITNLLDRQIEEAVEKNAAIRETADFREGVSAFLEKRKPQWSDR
jgi:methylglutaconyl-CoA hydratase